MQYSRFNIYLGSAGQRYQTRAAIRFVSSLPSYASFRKAWPLQRTCKLDPLHRYVLLKDGVPVYSSNTASNVAVELWGAHRSIHYS